MSSAHLASLRDILQRLLRRKATARLEKLLQKSHIADIAAVMRFLNARDRRVVFSLLPDRDAMGELLAEVDQAIATELVTEFEDDLLVDLLARMSPDDAADILGFVDEDRAELLLHRVHDDQALEGLMGYDEETAGGIMAPHFFALEEDVTAAEAIRQLQTAADVEMVFYIYVVNEYGHLVGVVSLRQLVVCAPQTCLKDLMEVDVISVRADVDREEVARKVARYNVLAMPVVDDSNKLLGIVTVDDIIDVFRDEATEDFLKMAGAGNDDLLEDHTVARSVRIRMPWLLASFVGGVIAAVIIGTFEHSLSQVAALAAFIPIVMGMGGNVGTQSSTIIVRGIATGQIDVRRLGATVGRELLVGLCLGTTYGFLLACVAWGFFADSGVSVGALAVSVGLSVCGCMAIAAVVGAGLPLVFERLSIDPAVATGPFVTTAVDVVGILMYFAIATSLIPQLSVGA